MARPRVLITGFGPFPGVIENPSAWLAEALEEQASSRCDAHLNARVLPTEWQATALMPDLYAALQPTLLIHFGVSQRAKELRVERFAHNRIAARADAEGAYPPNLVIRPCGPDRYDTALPAQALAAHLRRCGFPAMTSQSAGAYLCNFLYYHSLEWAQQGGALALFVHIPPVSGGNSAFSETALLQSAQEILRFVLNTAPPQAMAKPPIGPSIAATATVLSAKEA
jgi:pyroglutamyl-peptidase